MYDEFPDAAFGSFFHVQACFPEDMEHGPVLHQHFRCETQQALLLGLATKVFPAEALVDETMKTARALAAKGRTALEAIKRVVDCGMDVDLKTGCALEAEAFGVCFASPDAKEGATAFLEKRKPKFL